MMRRFVPGLFIGLVAMTGCLSPVGYRVDSALTEAAAYPRDLQPVSHAAETWAGAFDASSIDQTESGKAGEQPKLIPLTVPEELPGGKLPPITLPPPRPGNEEARNKAIEQLYPPLPPLGNDLPDPPGPEGRPLTLADLQQLAMSHNPLIRQAISRVEEMKGAAIQAGLPPNPSIGYEGDTINTTGGAGYQGGFIEQKAVLWGKLQLARAAAAMDLRNAELAKKRAETDLMTNVRRTYFAVLVAQESVRLNRSLVVFTNNVYLIYLAQLRRGGFAAPYEPMYLRALALQTRGALIQSRNRRATAWKQLAAMLGMPCLPPTALAGKLDIPVPLFQQCDVLRKALANHTDVLTALASIQQAEYQLKLARVTPLPDATIRVLVQKDNTGPPFGTSPTFAVSMPIPVWDRNQGNILRTQSALVRIHGEVSRVQNDLTSRLAEAFERYDNNRQLLTYYRDQILPDLVQVYRGVYTRFREEPAAPGNSPPGITDLVVAQQNLAGSVATYITVLGELWKGVVDVADLLQTPDLFSMQGPHCAVAEIPDLEKVSPAPTTLPPPRSLPPADPKPMPLPVPSGGSVLPPIAPMTRPTAFQGEQRGNALTAP